MLVTTTSVALGTLSLIAQAPAPAANQPAAGTTETKTAVKPKKVKKAKVKKTHKDTSKTTAPAVK